MDSVVRKYYLNLEIINNANTTVMVQFEGDRFKLISLTFDKMSSEKIFGTKWKFRQFCPTKFYHRLLISPYNTIHKKNKF